MKKNEFDSITGMEFYARFEIIGQLLVYINKVEKLELDPKELDKEGVDHCPKWDYFTEGKRFPTGKTKNFRRYEKLVPKNPIKYYVKTNKMFKRQRRVELEIEKYMNDLSGTAWQKLLWKDLDKEEVSYIAKKCSETEEYVKGIVMVNKKADQLVEGKEWKKERI